MDWRMGIKNKNFAQLHTLDVHAHNIPHQKHRGVNHSNIERTRFPISCRDFQRFLMSDLPLENHEPFV